MRRVHMTYWKPIEGALRTMRGLRGWSQERLAREARVSRRAIADWESGRDKLPDWYQTGTVTRLHKALGCPIERLAECWETKTSGPRAPSHDDWDEPQVT